MNLIEIGVTITLALLSSAATGISLYVAIRVDLAKCITTAGMAYENSTRAHARIDDLIGGK